MALLYQNLAILSQTELYNFGNSEALKQRHLVKSRVIKSEFCEIEVIFSRFKGQIVISTFISVSKLSVSIFSTLFIKTYLQDLTFVSNLKAIVNSTSEIDNKRA